MMRAGGSEMSDPVRSMEHRVFTIGHSTRALDPFIALLRHHGIELLADVRRMPQSRRHPHFSRAALARSLEAAGIGYRHFEPLGGLREPGSDSPNAGLRNAAFRGYADHMASPEFAAALAELADLARGRRVAVMCAEADPRHCHRLLLSDALVARGWTVEHIVAAGAATETHALARGARREDGRLVYPARQSGLALNDDRSGRAP
jgi:uncharacterized protein (DUF488 family)